MARIQRCPVDEDTQPLWDLLLPEHEIDVPDLPVSAGALDARHGAGTRMPTPCFCHTQASGKKRRMNDAERPGRNLLT